MLSMPSSLQPGFLASMSYMRSRRSASHPFSFSSTVVVNGQFPGPLIKANVGDTLNINVIDELSNPIMRQATSIVGVLAHEIDSFADILS